MIDFFNPSEPYSAQTQRFVARVQNGAGDIFEVATVARNVDVGDAIAWKREWTALAENAEREARAAEAAGYETTAATRYYHASQYYSQSDIFAKPGSPERRAVFRQSQDMFRRGAALDTTDIRLVSIECDDQTYDGYFCVPPFTDGRTVPAVLFIGGADATSEETYFSGKGLLDRGMAMLLLDMPGRGSAIYLKDYLSRYDMEVPAAAAFDWLEVQPEVDPARLAVAGISLGGYYAPRVAAFEPRVKALACWGGVFDVMEDIYDYHARIQPQFQWLLGTSDDASTRERIAAFNLRDAAPKITAPTMITHGRADRISALAGAERLHAAIGTANKQLIIYDGPGAGHCGYDDWRHVVPQMFDWLGDRLDLRSDGVSRLQNIRFSPERR